MRLKKGIVLLNVNVAVNGMKEVQMKSIQKAIDNPVFDPDNEITWNIPSDED